MGRDGGDAIAGGSGRLHPAHQVAVLHVRSEDLVSSYILALSAMQGERPGGGSERYTVAVEVAFACAPGGAMCLQSPSRGGSMLELHAAPASHARGNQPVGCEEGWSLARACGEQLQCCAEADGGAGGGRGDCSLRSNQRTGRSADTVISSASLIKRLRAAATAAGRESQALGKFGRFWLPFLSATPL